MCPQHNFLASLLPFSWQMPAVVQNFLAKSDKRFLLNLSSGIDRSPHDCQPRLSNWQCFANQDGELWRTNMLHYVVTRLPPCFFSSVLRRSAALEGPFGFKSSPARSKVHQEMAPPLRPKVSKRTKCLTSLHDEFHIWLCCQFHSAYVCSVP